MTHRWRCPDLVATYEQVLAGLDASAGLADLPCVPATFVRIDATDPGDLHDEGAPASDPAV